MPDQKVRLTERKWFYPVVFFLFFLVSVLPPYAEKGFEPQNTQDVIINLLMVATAPYQAWAPIFHIGTLLLIIFIAAYPEKPGRVLSVYMGGNYLIIAFAQSLGVTEKYGFVVHTAGLVAFFILGLTWLWAAFKGGMEPSFRKLRWFHYLLMPLALLAFWSPYAIKGTAIVPDFDPLLLLTSPDYGLTFCLTTPVFLYLLIVFYPKVNRFAYRITAFNGLLYGLFNLTHWFSPDTRWMGVLHVPLLGLSIFALIQSRK